LERGGWAAAKVFAGRQGTPDTPAAVAAYEVGRKWHTQSLSNIFGNGDGYLMQEPDGVAEKLWPNEVIATGAIFFNMTSAEIWEWIQNQL